MNLLFLTGAKFSGILELNGNFNISRSMTRLTPFVHQGQLNCIAIQAGFISLESGVTRWRDNPFEHSFDIHSCVQQEGKQKENNCFVWLQHVVISMGLKYNRKR